MVQPIFTLTQNVNEFRICALIFWISYSAFQRGTNAKARQELLELVASQNRGHGPKWLQANSVESQVWESEYAAVLDSYDAKFTKYANKWLDSDGGKKFSEVVLRNRSNVRNPKADG